MGPGGAQGRLHSMQHRGYWAQRMARLHSAWARLEARTAAALALLAAAAAAELPTVKADGGGGGGGGDIVWEGARLLPEGVRCYDVLEVQLRRRQGLATESKREGRLGWRDRLQAEAYRDLPQEHQPFACPCFEG
jgi:hypothetical protein